jgi:hypothetical protein
MATNSVRTTLVFGVALSGLWPGASWAITPGASKAYTITIVDISKETQRQVVVERGTPATYQGHVHTLLMPDETTIWAVWTRGHAGPCGPIKKSTDGGLTWNWVTNGPAKLSTVFNCPTIHRLVDPSGVARLFLFAGNGIQYQAYSVDNGNSWTPMRDNGLRGTVSPMSVLPVDHAKKISRWYDAGPGADGADGLPQRIRQADSTDGGLHWHNQRDIMPADVVAAASPNEPCVIRSPDGKQLLILMRVETGGFNSLYSVSDDEGATWSYPKELPASLTGHRHNAHYTADGRLVIVMRDVAAQSPTKGSFVAWVGTYDDIIRGREGQYRVKLLHQYPTGSLDCGYAGLERLPADGTFVATTYVKYSAGPEQNSIVSVRFQLGDLDARAARRSPAH